MESDHNRFLPILLGALEAEGVRVVSFPASRDIDLAGLDALLVHWPDKLFWEAAGSAEAAALIARLLARLALRPRRVKLVWMVHDLAPHDGRWFKRLAWPPYAAAIARLADAALTLSSGTRAAVLAAASGAGRKAARARLAPGLPRRGGRPRGPGGGARRSRLGRERAGLRLLRPAPALQGDRGPDRGLRRARRPGGPAADRRAPARPRHRRDPRAPRRRRRHGSA